MKRLILAAALMPLAATGLYADPEPPPRLSPIPGAVPVFISGPVQPSATMARLNKKGQVVLKFWTARNVEVTATRIIRDGKEVDAKITFYQTVEGWEEQSYDVKDIKLLGSDGKPLDKKMLLQLLKKERPVLYTYHDVKIDPTFLKVIKEGTPILVLPASAAGPNPS